jgi:hypothetical protein
MARNTSACRSDEYDAAQERGEVAGPSGGGERSGRERSPTSSTAADLGLSRKDTHEWRKIADAEAAEPGIVKRTLETCLANGEEPTQAAVTAAVEEAAAKAVANEQLKLSHKDRARIRARLAGAKDRNKELAKIAEEHGMRARHIAVVLRNTIAVPQDSTVEGQARKAMAMEAAASAPRCGGRTARPMALPVSRCLQDEMAALTPSPPFCRVDVCNTNCRIDPTPGAPPRAPPRSRPAPRCARPRSM